LLLLLLCWFTLRRPTAGGCDILPGRLMADAVLLLLTSGVLRPFCSSGAGPVALENRCATQGGSFHKRIGLLCGIEKEDGNTEPRIFSWSFLYRFLLDLHMRHYVHAAAHFVTSVTIDTGKATSLLFICNQLS
jgi:hypothetical protein